MEEEIYRGEIRKKENKRLGSADKKKVPMDKREIRIINATLKHEFLYLSSLMFSR
jgi:hypothetical protein